MEGNYAEDWEVGILPLVIQDGKKGTEVMMWFWRVRHSYLNHWTGKRHWNREEERDSEGGGEKELTMEGGGRGGGGRDRG